MACGIYKITKLLNNKIYIGRSVNILKRWNQHKNAADSSPLHKAIQKYGIENFKLEVLEECLPTELNEREIYWINYYNSCFGDGYNATLGGEGAVHPVKLSHEQLLEIIDKLQNTNETIKSIAQSYNVSTKTISDINNGKSRTLLDLTYPLRTNKFGKKEILKEELYNLLIKTKGDFEYIANYYNVTSTTIRNKCKSYNFSTKRKDYGWEDEQIYHSIKVTKCNKDTKEPIETFNSIREAARQLGINANSICKALKSDSHISSGYYWLKQ